jgi:hypothetical protein
MNNYKIDVPNPCPMSFRRLQNADFQCSSCNKKIIDFRNVDPEQIREKYRNTNVCGIFNSDQLQKRTFSLNYKIKFAILTFVAILGVNVKPLSAQDSKSHPKQTEAQKIAEKENKIQDKKALKKEYKWYQRRNKSNKKTVHRFTGCPSF